MEGLCDSIREVGLVLALVVNLDVELCNLVSIHARSRYFNRSLPVKVVVAEIKGQLLKIILLEGGVVVSYIEVGRCNTALGGVLGNQEEVIVVVRVAIFPFNYCGIDQSA